MIASSAPLRISYLGGGTDYQNYFSQYGGLVLGASINMKVFVFLNELSKVAEENVRFTYRKIESVASLMEIKHPVVREVLKIYAPNERLNIATFADLPGKSGLGSSSAFTVALITALQALAGNQNLEPKFVAENAINIERKILNEVGGIQDHYHATYGNLRSYRFGNFETKISEPYYSDKILQELSQFHYLLYVGSERSSAAYSKQTSHAILSSDSVKYFHEIKAIAEEGNSTLAQLESTEKIIEKLSELINESWKLKKFFGKDITNSRVDSLINRGLQNGATSSKLCGAGNSGYILFLVPESERTRFQFHFTGEILLKVSLSPEGYQVKSF